MKKDVPKNFTKFTGKIMPATLLKKRFQHRCLFSQYVEIFKNIFFTEHLLKTASV